MLYQFENILRHYRGEFAHLDGVELGAHGAAVGAVEGAREVGHGADAAVGDLHVRQVCGERIPGAQAVSGQLQLRRVRARGAEKGG